MRLVGKPFILIGGLIFATYVILQLVSSRLPLKPIFHRIEHPLTPKFAENQNLQLLFVGDIGTGNANQQASAQVMERICQNHSLDAVFLLGDNFYMQGVDSVRDPLWETHFEKMYDTPCLKKIKFYAILGNHDYRSHPQAQIDYTLQGSGRWTMPARHYTVDFDRTLSVFAIDTNWPDRCGFTFCQLDSVEQAIRESSAKWKIVVGHHPLLSFGNYKKTKVIHRWLLAPLFCQVPQHIYISGHDHNWQINQGIVGGCRINQIIMGIGGGDPYPFVSPQENQTLAWGVGFGAMKLTLSSSAGLLEIFTHESEAPVFQTKLDPNMSFPTH